MAANGLSGWDRLPDEILLQVLRYLEPYPITRLLQTSRRLQKLCLDDDLWKRYCFEESPWYQVLRNRRAAQAARGALRLGDDTSISGEGLDDGREDSVALHDDDTAELRTSRFRQMQDMANWDPTFPGEKISWYDEYIQRNGPASASWFQIPKHREGGEETMVEARGLALYRPNADEGEHEELLAVAPLDDGSVCLWDVRGTRGQQGRIVAKSAPEILFIDGPGSGNSRRSKKVDTGVTDCVSVHNRDHKAFFAVQSHLIEVDLNRLEVVDRESFEWSITALSPVHDGVPMTVGTSLGIHLHDFRERSKLREQAAERLDTPYHAIFDETPLPPYASLSQPTPVSILHLPQTGSHTGVTDDIYVSGRFTSILHYDRRKFPNIVDSIHSGAIINTLTALPYPFSTVENEVRRHGEFSTERALELRQAREGQTLIAGGVYKSRGSLELYGLSAKQGPQGTMSMHDSLLRNRQTAASSSILSVTTHGTKIVFSDGSGLIKWFERDGTTETRRMRIGHSESDDQRSIFASMPASDDLGRKILSTKSAARQGEDDTSSKGDEQYRTNNDNIMFWTGEKIGMVSFTTSPLCKAADFDDRDEEQRERDAEQEAYSNNMREALKKQADDVKFVSRLGYGP